MLSDQRKKAPVALSIPFPPSGTITEKLLQFIWQFQYFNTSELCTTEGEALEVVMPGSLNRNQGPDFLNAQVKINGTIFAGSVELHLKTTQWIGHGHHQDP